MIDTILGFTTGMVMLIIGLIIVLFHEKIGSFQWRVNQWLFREFTVGGDHEHQTIYLFGGMGLIAGGLWVLAPMLQKVLD